MLINKKDRIYRIVHFAVRADHRVKTKESENRDKYLDLAREVKKPWNMEMTVIQIIIGVLVTILKGWIKGLEGLGKYSLRSARIQKRVLESSGDLTSLKL